MLTSNRFIACLCFLLSGTAAISYQLIWLRSAISYFGVITPVISTMLSIFMLGLALGTLGAGKLARRMRPTAALQLYMLAELAVAGGALAIPPLFAACYRWLLSTGEASSGSYLFYSWLTMSAVLLPVCTLLGATLPLILRFLEGTGDGKNFGYLYFANLLGALAGCFLPLALIELYGFAGALHLTTTLSAFVAALAAMLYLRQSTECPIPIVATPVRARIPADYACVLFLTGFVALGSEIVWVRLFARITLTTVYAFAEILGIYLLASFIGSWLYLRCTQDAGRILLKRALVLLPAATLFPAIAGAEDWIHGFSPLSIALLSICLGFMTPWIIDRAGTNDPDRTARAYAYNFAGCILGPLATTYLFFPWLGLKGCLVLYGGLMLVAVVLMSDQTTIVFRRALALFLLPLVASFIWPTQEEIMAKDGRLHRDHVGYIGGIGKGGSRRLIVNGVGMTSITPLTKAMAYLPLAYRPESKSALVICFGMGSTLRALAKWPLTSITAVELSPGVIESFPYFYKDSAKVLSDPRVHIVVDDGRRFLNRTDQTFDLITIDPPPPLEASSSGLLYSTEFIGIAKSRLNAGGILAHWLPSSDRFLLASVYTALQQHFKYVTVIHGSEQWWGGHHLLASDNPIPPMTSQEFIKRMTPEAIADLQASYFKPLTPEQVAEKTMLPPIDPSHFVILRRSNMPISDDRLYNEFYLLREWGLYNP